MNDQQHEQQAHSDRRNMLDEIVSAKKAILTAFIPLILVGIGIMVVSYFTLQRAVEKIGEIEKKMDVLAERTNTMWYSGGWAVGPSSTINERRTEAQRQENNH